MKKAKKAQTLWLATLLSVGMVYCKADIKDGVIACDQLNPCPPNLVCWEDGFCYSKSPNNLNAGTEKGPNNPIGSGGSDDNLASGGGIRSGPKGDTGATGGTTIDVVGSGGVGGNIIGTIDSGDVGGAGGSVTEIVDSGADRGGSGGTAETNPDTGPTCTCFTDDTCCDGCLPTNQDRICDTDDIPCTTDVCRSGVCMHELENGNCLIGGECYRDGYVNPDNTCRYCDTEYDSKRWRTKSSGSSCDDGLFCTEIDVCDTTGFCTGSGNPCETDDPCIYCDENTDKCDYQTDMTWYDSTSNLTWEHDGNCYSLIWEESEQCCDDLVLCGHADWRMASIDDLRSLIRDCPNSQTNGECGVTSSCLSHSCDASCQECVWECHYPPAITAVCGSTWSSSIVADDPDYRWGVYFLNADVRYYLKERENDANGCGTFCVRSGH